MPQQRKRDVISMSVRRLAAVHNVDSSYLCVITGRALGRGSAPPQPAQPQPVLQTGVSFPAEEGMLRCASDIILQRPLVSCLVTDNRAGARKPSRTSVAKRHCRFAQPCIPVAPGVRQWAIKRSSVTRSLPLFLLHITKPSSSAQSRLSALAQAKPPFHFTMSIADVRKKPLPVTVGARWLIDARTVCLEL